MKKQKFDSNAKLVRHYFLELLADGEEHSFGEILAYINEKTAGAGVDGKRLTDEMVKSSIWYRLRYGTASYIQSKRGFYQMLPAFCDDGSNAFKINPDFVAYDNAMGGDVYVFETEDGSFHIPWAAFFNTKKEAEAEGFAPYRVTQSGLRLYANGSVTSPRRWRNARLAVVGNGKPVPPASASATPEMTKDRLLSAIETLREGGDFGYFNDELVTLTSLVYFAPDSAVTKAWADCNG
jgi:hypothetical protein